jgi:hypothetical protein
MKPLRKQLFLIFILAGLLAATGCIRLVGKAGYVKETPKERTERVVGFDTDAMYHGGPG